MIELGVNVDHVATVRQARRTYEPDPVWAAVEAHLGGADGITVHLREDRRHIQDEDVRRLRDLYLPELPRQWEREHPNFRFVPVLSEPAPEDQWAGRTGLVHEAILADFPDLSSHQVYACGSAGMVEAAYPAFQQHGLSQDDCFSDAFRLSAKIRTDTVELAKLGGKS